VAYRAAHPTRVILGRNDASLSRLCHGQGERQPAIRDRPKDADALWSPKRNPGEFQGWGLTWHRFGLLAVYPARTIHRDRDALRDVDFDLSTRCLPPKLKGD
jgi:hypothetical protein